MRFTHSSLVLTGGACAALLLSAQPALAGAAPQQAPQQSQVKQHAAAAAAKGCVPAGETGVYLSKEGTAKVTFSKPFLDGLKKSGATIDGIAPVKLTDNGTALTMPIGEKYDNIEFPSGRVCYPGGFRITQKVTGKIYEVEDFWVLFAAFGHSKFHATPAVNGVRSAAGELTMLNFSVPQAFMTGQFVPHNEGIGPKRVVMNMDAQWATHLNKELATDFKSGMHLFDTDIAWKGVPTKAFPNVGSFPSVGVAGLQSIADAIRSSL